MIPTIHIQHKVDTAKLLISLQGVIIKIEVNLVGHGLLSEPQHKILCESAQQDYDAFVSMQIVPLGQLFGGKICAALDRQHPRDLFDVKLLLDNQELTREMMTGFILSLISNDRPMYETLNPNLLNQKQVNRRR